MRRSVLFVTCVFLMVGASSVRAGDTLAVNISPRITYQPGSVIIRISVEPHADNRALVVETDSGAYFRSSEVQLDGAHEARTRQITYADLPGGEYDVVVRVMGSDHARAEVRGKLVVLGSEGTEP
jgi:hypothetical protein